MLIVHSHNHGYTFFHFHLMNNSLKTTDEAVTSMLVIYQITFTVPIMIKKVFEFVKYKICKEYHNIYLLFNWCPQKKKYTHDCDCVLNHKLCQGKGPVTQALILRTKTIKMHALNRPIQ